MMYDDEIVIVRPGRKSTRTGDTVDDWTQATRTPQADVNVQPLSQAETVTLGRDVTVTLWRLLSARGVDVDLASTDRVEYAGRTLAVLGEVARYTRNGGHVEAVLQVARG